MTIPMATIDNITYEHTLDTQHFFSPMPERKADAEEQPRSSIARLMGELLETFYFSTLLYFRSFSQISRYQCSPPSCARAISVVPLFPFLFSALADFRSFLFAFPSSFLLSLFIIDHASILIVPVVHLQLSRLISVYVSSISRVSLCEPQKSLFPLISQWNLSIARPFLYNERL